MNMEFKRKLPIPKEIKEQYPITPEMEKIKAGCGHRRHLPRGKR